MLPPASQETYIPDKTAATPIAMHPILFGDKTLGHGIWHVRAAYLGDKPILDTFVGIVKTYGKGASFTPGSLSEQNSLDKQPFLPMYCTTIQVLRVKSHHWGWKFSVPAESGGRSEKDQPLPGAKAGPGMARYPIAS